MRMRGPAASRSAASSASVLRGSPKVRRSFAAGSTPRSSGSTARPASRRRSIDLHALLEHQPYRLAYWRTAFDEINYRRFFDVNDLGALRMEDPRVFAAAHGRVLRLIADGQITGLRIDHADGLLDPAAYFEHLDTGNHRGPVCAERRTGRHVLHRR